MYYSFRFSFSVNLSQITEKINMLSVVKFLATREEIKVKREEFIKLMKENGFFLNLNGVFEFTPEFKEAYMMKNGTMPRLVKYPDGFIINFSIQRYLIKMSNSKDTKNYSHELSFLDESEIYVPDFKDIIKDLYLKGFSAKDIMGELNNNNDLTISISTVYRKLNEIKKRL